MANKKGNKKSKDIDIKATKKGVRVKAKGGKATTISYSSKLFISIAVVVLLVVTAVLIFRFGFPTQWNDFIQW